MRTWLMQNWGTILVLLGLAGLVTAIFLTMRKDKKQGRSCCGGSCSKCAMCSACHKAHKTEE